MSVTFELNATTRTVKGKGASRRLRHQEQIPAIVYGSGKPPVSLVISHFEVLKALKQESFYSHILTLHVDKTPQQVVLKAVHRHPYKPKIMHMDFLRIDATHKINMHVPLHFTGEAEAPGIIVDKGVMNKLIQDIEIRCLPANLPEYIAIDVAHLKLNEALSLSHVVLPTGVELAHKIEDPEHDVIVVNIAMPRAAIEEEQPAAISPEVEATAVSTATPDTQE